MAAMNQPPPYPPYQQPYAQPPQQTASVVDAIVPTNPLAAVACWVGIFSLFTCYGGVVLGPFALIMGIISLKKGAAIRETAYGRGTSLARSWIGIVTGVLSTLIGVAVIVMAVIARATK
jgi:hypothetical protein